jgi:HEPN domain-containing protein
MSDRPDRIPLVRQWVAKAEEDIRTAEYALTMPENCPHGTICFHAQQCVEKYIKALLVWRSIEFPRIHDIGELVALLPEEISFPLTEEEQEKLTDHAVVSRYPGDGEPIDRIEAEQAVALARKVRDAIRRALPEKAYGDVQ